MHRTTLRNGKRVAHVDRNERDGINTVSVWYDGGELAARWFKGHSTCSNDYKSRHGAFKAARAFLTH